MRGRLRDWEIRSGRWTKKGQELRFSGRGFYSIVNSCLQSVGRLAQR